MSVQSDVEWKLGFEFSWPVSRAEMHWKQFNEWMESPVFATVNNGIRYLWTLRLYPKGYMTLKFPSADQQPNVSLGLCLNEGSVKETVEAKYQLFVQGGTQKDEILHTFNVPRGSVCPALCLQNEIKTRESFGARVWFKESAFEVDQLFPNPKFKEFEKNRLLYEQTILGDQSRGCATGNITIVVANEHRIPCHQLFLQEASPVFHTMLQPTWSEGREREVRINDVPLKSIKQLLFYCYVDGMPEGWEENAMGLLCAAHKYDMQAVVRKCEKELVKRLELSNAVELLSLALELNLKLLGMQSTQLLVDKWGAVSQASQEELLRHKDANLAVLNAFGLQKNVICLGL